MLNSGLQRTRSFDMPPASRFQLGESVRNTLQPKPQNSELFFYDVYYYLVIPHTSIQDELECWWVEIDVAIEGENETFVLFDRISVYF